MEINFFKFYFLSTFTLLHTNFKVSYDRDIFFLNFYKILLAYNNHLVLITHQSIISHIAVVYN